MKTSALPPPSAFPSVIPHLGRTVLELRRRAGLRQSSLAATAGISRATLSALETGKRTHLSVVYLERLAHTLELPLPLLLALAEVRGLREGQCRI